MSDAGTAAKLAAIASISNQKERITSYLTLLSDLLSNPAPPPAPLVAFGTHFTTSTSMAMVVGRRILDCYVTALVAGSDLPRTGTAALSMDEEGKADAERWDALGKLAFAGEEGRESRRDVVEGVLTTGGISGWCDEQTTVLRHLHSSLLEEEEDWEGAAKALMHIQLEGVSRQITDEEKLAVYMKIIRLFLECGEWGQAQTYFTRATLLPRPADKETRLSMRLSQARLFDFGNRFNEAARTYHEVSHDADIQEEDRLQMLRAAVTTSILAPAGPQRSRILASLNRDDRVHTSLPGSLSTMLRKMLLEYIVRPAEIQEFEQGLAEHQRATVEGGGTVLERAVREHNAGACGKVYDNISFEALGAVLGLDSEAAEGTARRMIEQGRLRAWIDQPLQLLYFESRSQHDTDADAQGTAGGLGVERVVKDIEPVSWTERWDDRIRATSLKVEAIAEAIQQKGLVPVGP